MTEPDFLISFFKVVGEKMCILKTAKLGEAFLAIVFISGNYFFVQ